MENDIRRTTEGLQGEVNWCKTKTIKHGLGSPRANQQDLIDHTCYLTSLTLYERLSLDSNDPICRAMVVPIYRVFRSFPYGIESSTSSPV